MSRKITVWHLDPAAFTLFYERPLVASLREQGIDAHLLTSRSIYDNSTAPHESYFYFKLLEKLSFLNQSSRLRRTTRGLHYLFDQAKLTRRVHQTDIVHIHWSLIPTIDRIAWRTWHNRGAKCVFTVHDLVPNHLPLEAAKSYFLLYHEADALILHTPQNRESLAKWVKRLLPSSGEQILKKARVIPMGIPEHHREISKAEARHQLKLSLDTPLLLFLGNIRKYKGLPVLLAAFRQILQEIPETQLYIVGHVTPDYPGGAGQIREMAADIPNISMELTFVPQDMPSVYYAAADITVLPYFYVTGSAVAVSALAQGCPIVASDTGGLPDIIIPGQTGQLVSPGDAHALANALINLLKNPELRQKMSQQARAVALQKHTWTAIAAQTKAVYEELLS